MSKIIDVLIPPSQKMGSEDLHDGLNLNAGEVGRKRSAFLIMLVLSAIIAASGVLADSTATVIGAMIIAPLATPIMGIALGIVSGQFRFVIGSLAWVGVGVVIVVTIGAAFAAFVTDPDSLATNRQVTGRTSPGLLDLAVALATGTAGALAMTRRDVSAVLPGVAIAISLVPPLGVVGVCAGVGEWNLAVGALWLFLSNVLALVIAGSIVFTIAGYARGPHSLPTARRRRAYAVVAIASAIVVVPLAINTIVAFAIASWETQIRHATQSWLSEDPVVTLSGIDWVRLDATIAVVSDDGDIPDVSTLTEALSDLPEHVNVTVRVQTEAEYTVR